MITDLTVAKSIVSERTGETLPVDIDILLEGSAGLSNTTKVYRPYFAAARIIDRVVFAVESTPDAVFRKRQAAVDALMLEQQSYDESEGLAIPKGMEALTSDERGRQSAAVGGVIQVARS